MEDLRFFAILDNNRVFNIVTFPENPPPSVKRIWKDIYIWIYDGNFWNSLNESESFDLEIDMENANYVDSIVGDPQDYLNTQFPNAAENEMVINRENLPTEILTETQPESILSSYEGSYFLKEYSIDKSITNNKGAVGYTYNETLNAFIPPKPNETYILNTETFEWEPDPNIDYELYGDGIMYRWDGENWILSQNNEIN